MQSGSILSINRQWYGTVLVVLSGMLYGIIGYCGTHLFEDQFTIPAMLFWRFGIAALWMVMSNLFSKQKFFVQVLSRDVLLTMLFAAITYSSASAFYFLAARHIGTGLAMVIFFSFPVFVTLFAWVLSGWRMNKYAFLSLVAVMIGLSLLKGNAHDALNLLGILAAITAAFLYAVYVYGSQFSAKKMDSRLLTLLICLGNAFIFLLITCSTKTFIWPTTWHSWLFILTIGIIATALPIQFLLDGLKQVSPIKASILSVLEPVVTLLIGTGLLHETISFAQTLGVMIVLVGAILIQFEKAAHA